jgi:mono/diheme cytochrome c family protein
MKIYKLALVMSVIALLSIACSKEKRVTNINTSTQPTVLASPVATPDELASARANFAKHCSVCHGDKAEGKTVTVEGRRLKVPRLRSGHALHHPDADLVKQITNGGEGMPAFKDKLTPQEINDLVRFIRKELQAGQEAEMKHNMKMD